MQRGRSQFSQRSNTGLILFGDVGTGKFAGCIANALLDRDIPVLMTAATAAAKLKSSLVQSVYS